MTGPRFPQSLARIAEGGGQLARGDRNTVVTLALVSVQCPGSGEQGHWVAAVVGRKGVGEVGV